MPLEKYYSGDAAFSKYASAFDAEWATCDYRNELLTAFRNNIELAKPICYEFGRDYRDWMLRNIPALDGLRPVDCLDDPQLLNRLKEYLLRMP